MTLTPPSWVRTNPKCPRIDDQQPLAPGNARNGAALRACFGIARRCAIFAAFVFSVWALPASAQPSIKLGEMNSYKAFPAFLEPYRKGWEMAVDEVNKDGEGYMKEWRFVDGKDALPSDTEVLKMGPK